MNLRMLVRICFSAVHAWWPKGGFYIHTVHPINRGNLRAHFINTLMTLRAPTAVFVHVVAVPCAARCAVKCAAVSMVYA